MTIDEEKIREAAEGEADDKLKEACVRTYCEVLDAIRLLEENALALVMPDQVLDQKKTGRREDEGRSRVEIAGRRGGKMP